MKRKIKAGTTSLMLPIFVRDTSSTTGAGLSLAFNAASLVGEYRRAGDSSWTAITLATATLGTFTSGGWIADGSLTGAYEVGIPNAAVASGVPWVQVRYRGAANMLPVLIEIELDAIDYQDGVRQGMTALPNAAAEASGGLPTLSAAQASNGTINANVHRWLTGTPNALQSGRVDSRPGAIASGILAASTFAADFWTTILSTLGLATGNLDSQLSGKATSTNVSDAQAAIIAAMPAAAPSAATVRDAILDRATASHATAGTVGKAIADAATSSATAATQATTAATQSTAAASSAATAATQATTAATQSTAGAASAATAATQSTAAATSAATAATQATSAASQTTAGNLRSALGLATNDLDSQLDAILAASGGGTTPEAIAEAVWDLAASGHTTSGTFGGLLAALSVGAGSGPIAITVITEPNALVSALKNGILSGWGYADENGEKVLQLTAGVHEFRSALVGFTGDAVDHDVTADDEVEVPLTALTMPSSAPGSLTLYGYCWGENGGAGGAGTVVNVQIMDTDVAGNIFPGPIRQETSGVNSYVYFTDFPYSTRYEAWVEGATTRKKKGRTPASGTDHPIGSIVGDPT